MGEFLTIGNLMTLVMLILLQAVLGFDNLLYISIESKRVSKRPSGVWESRLRSHCDSYCCLF